MVEERKIMTVTPEEEIRWFLSEVIDGVVIEMSKGVFKVVYSYSNKRRRYELRIYKENSILFFAEGSFWDTPIRMLEGHIAFLKMVAKTLREIPVFEAIEKARREKEQEEEKEESEE
jgi:hypothetical protein